MIRSTKLSTAAAMPLTAISSATPTTVDRSADLLETATADFRANLRHPRALTLLVDYYIKQGLTSEQVRQAVRNASTAPTRPIHLVLPAQAAA